MICANRSLHLIIIGNVIYCNVIFFSSVDQNKGGRLVTCSMTIYSEIFYLGHIFQDVG